MESTASPQSASYEEDDDSYISPGLFLMAGLVAAPIVFFWFILRRGYRRSLRVAVFTYWFAQGGFLMLFQIVLALFWPELLG